MRPATACVAPSPRRDHAGTPGRRRPCCSWGGLRVQGARRCTPSTARTAPDRDRRAPAAGTPSGSRAPCGVRAHEVGLGLAHGAERRPTSPCRTRRARRSRPSLPACVRPRRRPRSRAAATRADRVAGRWPVSSAGTLIGSPAAPRARRAPARRCSASGTAAVAKYSQMRSSVSAGSSTGVGAVDGAPRPADLLVVGDGRVGRAHVHAEAQVGLVVAHAQRRRRDDGLELVVAQPSLDLLPRRGVELARVGGDGRGRASRGSRRAARSRRRWARRRSRSPAAWPARCRPTRTARAVRGRRRPTAAATSARGRPATRRWRHRVASATSPSPARWRSRWWPGRECPAQR